MNIPELDLAFRRQKSKLQQNKSGEGPSNFSTEIDETVSHTARNSQTIEEIIQQQQEHIKQDRRENNNEKIEMAKLREKMLSGEIQISVSHPLIKHKHSTWLNIGLKPDNAGGEEQMALTFTGNENLGEQIAKSNPNVRNDSLLALNQINTVPAPNQQQQQVIPVPTGFGQHFVHDRRVASSVVYCAVINANFVVKNEQGGQIANPVFTIPFGYRLLLIPRTYGTTDDIPLQYIAFVPANLAILQRTSIPPAGAHLTAQQGPNPLFVPEGQSVLLINGNDAQRNNVHVQFLALVPTEHLQQITKNMKEQYETEKWIKQNCAGYFKPKKEKKFKQTFEKQKKFKDLSLFYDKKNVDSPIEHGDPFVENIPQKWPLPEFPDKQQQFTKKQTAIKIKNSTENLKEFLAEKFVNLDDSDDSEKTESEDTVVLKSNMRKNKGKNREQRK